ncbi:hypothetical protein [Cryobacterium sp. Hb1]|nr:hypothetical protein [Cryobacterium sp. Hb1]
MLYRGETLERFTMHLLDLMRIGRLEQGVVARDRRPIGVANGG